MSDGMSGWSVTSTDIDGFTYFILKNDEGWLVYRAYPANQNSLNPSEGVVVYYWQAPLKYLGNRVRHSANCCACFVLICFFIIPFYSPQIISTIASEELCF